MRYRVLVLAVLAAVALAAPLRAAEPPRFDPAAADKLVADTLRAWDVPGVAVVVVRDGKTLLLKGYGTKVAGRDAPVTADTLFPLASCSKAFTSTLVAALVDDEKLGWDDPVRKHLPTFRLADPNADALVTVRDLLTHRTGVGSHDMLWYLAPWTRADAIRRIAKLPPAGQFRGSYHYSSLMFMAAGQAAANRGDAPWEDLVRDKITGPLGMTGVTFTTAEFAKAKDRAAGHRRGTDGKPEPMPAYEAAEPNPAGSVSATARDLAAWLNFHLADGVVAGKPVGPERLREGSDTRRVVSAANLAETKTPHTPIRRDAAIRAVYPDTVQTSYAMGWVVYDHRGKHVVAHGGVIDGFRAQVTLLPGEKLGIALLNNLHDTKMNIALTNALIDRLCGLDAKDWNAIYLGQERDERDAKRAAVAKRDRDRKPGTPPSADLTAFAGEYADPAYGTGKVTVTGGKLVWSWSSFRVPLEHFEGDTFRATDGFFADDLVPFVVTDGVPTALTAMGVRFVRSAK